MIETFDPISPNDFPDFVDRVYSVVLRQGQSIGAGPGFPMRPLSFSITGSLERDHFRLDLGYDHERGAPTITASSGVDEPHFRELMAEVRNSNKHWFVAHLQVYLGLDVSLHEPAEIGPYTLDAREVTQRRTIETHLRHFQEGDVNNHVLAFPVEAYDGAQACRLGAAEGGRALSLFAFALDRLILPLQRVQAYGPPIEGDLRESIKERLRNLGCRLGPAGRTVHGAYLEIRREDRDLWERFAQLSLENRMLVQKALDSYNRALSLSRPHTGSEFYEDRALAITLWSAIVEGMGDPSIPNFGERTKQLLKAMGSYPTWEEFNTKVRTIRHVVSHKGHRNLINQFDRGYSLSDVAQLIQETAHARADELGKSTARRAILYFLERGGWPSPQKHEEPKKDKRPRIAKGELRKLKKANKLAGEIRTTVDRMGDPSPPNVRCKVRQVADLLQGLEASFRAEALTEGAEETPETSQPDPSGP